MSEAVDKETLAMLKEVMEEDFRELIHTFLNDVEAKLPLLSQLLEQDNPEEVRRAAHSLKGSSGNLGALPMSALCLQIEQSAKEGHLTGLATVLAALAGEYSTVKTILLDAIDQ